MSFVVRMERAFSAPPARVYRAWLEPALLQRWMAPGEMTATRVEVNERAGGYYRIWHEHADADAGGFECEIVELVPDRRIVWRWGFVGPQRTTGFDSVLTITLEPADDGGTLLTLVHEKLDDLAAALPAVASNVEGGWKSALDKLSEAIA